MPIFGGRNWTIVSALLLLVPTVALGVAVQNPELGFPVLLVVAALAGVGGGNFASSMANISFFYPEKEKGRALGLNAAGGNLGTAAVQWAVPIVVVIGAGMQLQCAGFMFVPLVLIAAVLALALHGQPVERQGGPAGLRRRRPVPEHLDHLSWAMLWRPALRPTCLQCSQRERRGGSRACDWQR